MIVRVVTMVIVLIIRWCYGVDHDTDNIDDCETGADGEDSGGGDNGIKGVDSEGEGRVVKMVIMVRRMVMMVILLMMMVLIVMIKGIVTKEIIRTKD